MYPAGPSTAFLTLGMAPGNPARLEATVKQAGKTMEDVTIPMGCVKLFKGGKGTALEVPIMPTPKEKSLEMFRGWGVAPLILTVDDAPRPGTEEIRKELWIFMSKCRGHKNVSGVGQFYDKDDPTPWPQKVVKELKPEELWPEYKHR